MKKIFLSLFVFIVSFMLIGGVSAKKVCEYDNYKIEFINNNVNVYFNDKLLTEKIDYTNISVEFNSFLDNKCPEEVYIGELYNSDKTSISLIISENKYETVSKNKKYVLSSEYADYINYKDGINSCGNDLITKIPTIVPKVISIMISTIQVAVPIVLVIMGMFDFAKAMSAGKEEDIKKNQKMFIKRLISGILVFCVFVIVKFVVSIVADNNRVMDCADCFISNNCD